MSDKDETYIKLHERITELIEQVGELTERAESAEAAVAKGHAGLMNKASESRLIRVALERVMAGESAKSIAKDYGLDADTFNRPTAMRKKLEKAEQKMLEADALASKQVDRAEDLQDNLDREKENVRILEAQVERLQSALEELQNSSELQAGAVYQAKFDTSVIEWYRLLCEDVLAIANKALDTQPPKPCSNPECHDGKIDVQDRYTDGSYARSYTEQPCQECQPINPLMSDYLAIKDAATKLLEACEHQDNCENLCEKIDGDLLDNLRAAIGKKYVVEPSGECPECKTEKSNGLQLMRDWLKVNCAYWNGVDDVDAALERIRSGSEDCPEFDRQECCGRIKPGHRTDCPQCKPDQEVD